MKLKLNVLLCATLLLSGHMFGQVYSNKEVGKKNQELADSLKSSEYPYVLPIWGEKATKLGFNLPYSAGFSVNYFTQESDLSISDLYVGFNHGDMYNLDEIVRFDNSVAQASSINVRPDFWLFPFLNIYGIFGQVKSSTTIQAGIFVPNADGVWNEVANFTSKANFEGTTMGFGMTPTMGVGNGWLAIDMNMAWTDISALDKPAFSFIVGPRFGKTFKFKNPDRALAVWAGGFRVKLASNTAGDLRLDELFDVPADELQTKVDNGLAKVDDAYDSVNNWWESLSPADQLRPKNKVKYDIATNAIDKASGVLTSMDEALNDDQSASVQYSLQKKPKDMWNFITGAQFQLNKHFMYRLEVGFLGSRTQLTTGLQYRFGL